MILFARIEGAIVIGAGSPYLPSFGKRGVVPKLKKKPTSSNDGQMWGTCSAALCSHPIVVNRR